MYCKYSLKLKGSTKLACATPDTKNPVETHSSSNAAALYPEERVTEINLVTLLITQTNSMKTVIFYRELLIKHNYIN